MIGQTISHYKILDKLGEGGMGVVYKAQDLKLDRVVAVKFLPPHLSASEDLKARFMQEARATAALNDTNILNTVNRSSCFFRSLNLILRYFARWFYLRNDSHLASEDGRIG